MRCDTPFDDNQPGNLVHSVISSTLASDIQLLVADSSISAPKKQTHPPRS
jgi:hypothetical protein